MSSNGGGSKPLDEHCDFLCYVPVIIAHFFNKPIQNSDLLRKHYDSDLLGNWTKDCASRAERQKTGGIWRKIDKKKWLKI